VEESKSKVLRWIMITMAVWGGLIALGVLLPDGWSLTDGKWSTWKRSDGLGALVVLGVTGLPLIVWALYLRHRENRNDS